MHAKQSLGMDIRGIDLADTISAGRPLSPGQLVKDELDYGVDVFDVNRLWDALPAEMEFSSKRHESMCLRAWITTRLAYITVVCVQKTYVYEQSALQ